MKSVQPLVFERISLPQLGGRAAILVGAEVSSQLLTADNPLKAKVKKKRSGQANVTVKFTADGKSATATRRVHLRHKRK